ncbi:hypothetical protein D5086_007227 [Populus alba]|uniref:Uncharacterized protein n=1 Tax=Populus alba TaxID=43335 RepID=A0ACC4CMS0_POPAL
MDAFGGYFVDEKAILVENIFLNFLKVMMVTIRFKPYLKNACRRFVMELSSTFISDDNPNKIKRANNSRNWETGVSTGVVTCTSAMGIASAREQICRPQRVRMQETSKEIPAGSLPRSLNVILRHDIVEQARAGDMCQRAPSTGSEKPLLSPCIYSQFSAGSSTAGLIPDVWPMVVKLDEVQRMRNAPDLFNKLVDSISPTVFGHQDIKRALLLMLFGGVHNFTHEGVNLREDIDACIVGDPSCAKSQSLKYTSGIVPRSVYTSGKSSSATGLTATVAKEPETAEFCIECGVKEIDLSEIQEANHDDGVGALVMRLRQHEEAVMRDGTGRVDKMSLIRKEGYLIVVDYGSRPEAEGDGARQSSSKDDRILAVAPNYVVE